MRPTRNEASLPARAQSSMLDAIVLALILLAALSIRFQSSILAGSSSARASAPAAVKNHGLGQASGALDGFDLPPGGVRLPELEVHLIRQALERSRGGLTTAARLLGISYKTLQYRVRKFGLDRETFLP